MSVAVILGYIFQYLPSAIVGVQELVAFITKARANLQQSGEWTPELESAFLQSLIDRALHDPAYHPDPSRPVAPTIVPPDAGNAA